MNFKNFLRVPLLLILCVALASIAFTQTTSTTGTIRGTATDDEGMPLPGVEITIKSPSLQGTRTTLTNEKGAFNFMALTPGTYEVTAKLQAFNTVVKTNVKVYLEFTTRVDITMSPGVIEEEITVVSTSPVIDATKTEVGADFDSEILRDMPTGRTFQEVAFMSPGAVGGTDPGSTYEDNPSIMGASVAENRYIIDGVDTTDPAFGTFGTNIPFNFIDEIEVKAGGYQAEYGGALGGIVNVLVKTGGNEYHGSLFGYLVNDTLTGETPEVAREEKFRGYTKYDVGADLGGYFIKDKLWFYAAFNPFWQSEDFTTVDGIPGSGISGHDVTEKVFRPYFAGKLSFQISPEHKLTISGFGEISKLEDINSNWNVKEPVRYDRDQKGFDASLVYDWSISPTMLFSFLGAIHRQKNNYTPEHDVPHIEDGFGAYSIGYPGRVVWGGSNSKGFDKRYRNLIKPTFNVFLGNHQFKVGAEYRHNYYHDNAWRPGPGSNPALVEWGYTAEQPGAYWRLRSWGYYNRNYKQDSEGVTNEFSVYLQDTWNVTPWFSLVLGVRADQFNAKGLERPPNPQLKYSATQYGIKIDWYHQIAPRIGFTVDPLQNGRSKIYGHYGKFYESVPLDINARMFGYENYDFFFYYYPTDAEGNEVLPSWDNPGQIWDAWTSGSYLDVQPNADRGDTYVHGQYTQEYLIGAEYEIMPDMSITVKGIYRSLEDVIEDISFDGGITYILTNPEGYQGINELTGEPLEFPKPERIYKALEFSLKKKLSNNYQFYFSYLLSKNEGNHGGLFRQDNQQMDPNITSAWDLPSLLLDPVTGEQVAYGLLNNDRTHQFKFYGSYHVPSGFLKGLVVGAYGAVLSGIPVSKYGEHIDYGTMERFVTPRGSEGRTDTVWWLDLHLEYPFNVSNVQISAIVDAFNVFNLFGKNTSLAAIQVDQEWSWGVYVDDPDPTLKTNDNWNQPSDYQDPWSVRFGLKLAW